LLSLYSRSPGTNGVTAVLLITSLLSHSSSALRHLVASARLHGVHDLNNRYRRRDLPRRIMEEDLGLSVDHEGDEERKADADALDGNGESNGCVYSDAEDIRANDLS
ncbi:hypothetical protein C8J55DRAFT_510331, partial [Lentinula edodes]